MTATRYRRFPLAAMVLALALHTEPGNTMPNTNLSSWTAVTVGVADLDEALRLWVDDFGFVVAERRTGPDAGLARLWSIDAEDISRQALVRTPGSRLGMLHLVEFVDPDPPVRAGAQVFDSVPKNLDIYVTDMPARLASLAAAGRSFLNDNYSEMTAPNGITFREMHMPGHDRINIVLLEIFGSDMTVPAGDFSGIGPLILIVDDATAEKAFYRDVIGLDLLSDNLLEGPSVEKMIGLPPGAALDVSIWGRSGWPFGQIEVIDYRGVDGNNLYPRARPKSLGVLHVSYETSGLEPMRRRLDDRRIEFSEHGSVSTLYGSGPAISFRSPAGFRIELHQRRPN